MAEVLAVVTPVIDMLLQLLVKEGNSFKHLHREVKSLKNELECVQCFLKDAEEKSDKEDMTDGVKAWLKQVRDEAYHIEDVIDLYLLHVGQRYHSLGSVGLLRRISHIFKALKPRNYTIVSQIEEIKLSLREIKDRGGRYGFSSLTQASTSGITEVEHCGIRLGSLFIEDDEFLDIHSTRDELMTRLVEGSSTRTVISLLGMGGIGKTTLAKKVYDAKVVKAHFDCYVWITVSQSYNLEKLLGTMAKKICPEWESGVIEEQVGYLREFLETKRYVIVFDDVWQVDFWGVIKHALPTNNRGSRVIITTRNEMVATSCQDNSCHLVKKLTDLSQEMAWQLFCKKAFRFGLDGHCPEELEQLSLEIVRRCQGLPLVISSVAGLLSTKEKAVSEWQKLYDTLNSELERNPHLSSISKILSLSYNNLPYYLKPCFLYFGMFLEGRPVNEITLYGHWIAEGFVKEKRDKTLEQVAEEYLNELIQRNLVQIRGLFFDGSSRLCQVHDLMRDIIVSRADELGFYQIVDEKKSIFSGKCRRLSIHDCAKNCMMVNDVSGVRSILLFNIDCQQTNVLVDNWFRKCKLLKVLDFTDIPIEHLPKGLGNLFHLKYLSVRNTKLKSLPKSIGELRNLEVLNLQNTLVCELPVEINRLQNLRHISSIRFNLKSGLRSDAIQGLRIHEGIGCLGELQTLMNVEVHDNGIGLVNDLKILRRLRNLGIFKLPAELGRTLCASIEKMTDLERLILASNSEAEILDLQAILSPPRFLWVLCLVGRLPKISNWILELSNLRTLILAFSRLSDDPLKCLQSLHKLEHLHLHNAYDGEEIHIEEGGFQKLKFLELCELHELRVIKIGNGALSLLEELRIGSCPQLKEVPTNIQHLKNLSLIEISEMPMEFVLGMQSNGIDQCCWKVKHVPRICSWYRFEGDLIDVL